MLENYLSSLSYKSIQVVDLFSGCGGLSYGFKEAGCEIVSGIELDTEAAITASYNLHWKEGVDREHFCKDIRNVNIKEIKQTIDYSRPLMVIGGPPCQAYSRAGIAKLRSLGEDRIHTKDGRGMLYQDFINFAIELNADWVVMENVLEATNYGGKNIPEIACEILKSNSYSAGWTILNAADFGVPQTRERVFMVASKNKEVGVNILPAPTHKAINNKITQGKKRINKFKNLPFFLEPKEPRKPINEWVSTREALSDLPSLHKSSKSNYRYYPLNVNLPYISEPENSFQRLMRRKKSVSDSVVTGHGYRKTLRDFPIFERMEPGDNYLKAHEIAEDIFEKHCERYEINPSKHYKLYEEEKKKFVPPYSRDKFFGKWTKLHPDLTSHTLTAHLSTDTYSHIHPWESRGISVREAARLQSFPDDFIFQCGMSEAYKQIGNAVPPLLAKALASSICDFEFQTEIDSKVSEMRK
ncbi:DNA (cytosine-5)-methyltransferase 1 [Marinococcus luteus]|uniref:DNA (cytosine-5-)-methyltransferase n=1 Tax=Marinococcus luteus TaxID=1122204 RepID=A0A1H2QFZ2_9BACI|nr:DNA cytosine methyltransferase [Marinococcus luteus]SDW06015.1 DNA (cytosine-5)-methyltransferase 1 [Marinococcus luteus]